ncbi:unnamed protein product [Durusdinium trenchii]
MLCATSSLPPSCFCSCSARHSGQAEANSEENMSWPHGTPTSAWTDARGRHGPWTEGAQQQQRCTKHIDSLEKEAGVSSRRPRTWRQRSIERSRSLGRTGTRPRHLLAAPPRLGAGSDRHSNGLSWM